MKATKGNKEYTITATEKKAFQDRGFDILDDAGNVIAYGRGKIVPYGDYAALKEENAALKARVAELESREAEKEAAKKTKKAGE